MDFRTSREATFRIATLADIEGIILVHTASREAAYRGRMPDDLMDGDSSDRRRERWHDRLTLVDPESVTWLAEIDGQIVGFCQSGLAVPDAPGPSRHIHSLYVDPGFQGLRLGRALLDRTTGTIATAGFPAATLHVFGFNEEAIRFYEHLGWARVGVVPDMPIHGYLYRKTLVPAAL